MSGVRFLSLAPKGDKMKQRIVEKIDSNGNSEFYIQEKFLWFWIYRREHYCEYSWKAKFDSVKKCCEWLKNEEIEDNYRSCVHTKYYEVKEVCEN